LSLQHLPLKLITEKDLQRLVLDKIPETKNIEYKRDLCLVSDKQKCEFLSDVTAMANTVGGDIIYGMSGKPGYASDLVGLKNFNEDDSLCKIENLLRDFVQPRLQGYIFSEPVLLENGNKVLILRIPSSFTAPHMVRHQGITRFCGRNAAGKYDLDVQELRSVFVENESMGEKLKNFRLDRINKLISGEGLKPMQSPNLVVIHVLPVVGVRRETFYSSSDFTQLDQTKDLRPMFDKGVSGWGADFNFDGYCCTAYGPEREFMSYVQVYRNGFMESVDSGFLAPITNSQNGEVYRILYLKDLENILIEDYDRTISAFRKLGCEPPYAVSISLLNVKDYDPRIGLSNYFEDSKRIDRDHLLAEELLVESNLLSGAEALKPAFDQIWNACGHKGSLNYNPDGTRNDV